MSDNYHMLDDCECGRITLSGNKKCFHCNKSTYENTLEKNYELSIKDTVFFRCGNPGVGIIKRMGKNKDWADVHWITGINTGYTSRVETRHLELLNGVLNWWLSEDGVEDMCFRYASPRFYIKPKQTRN